MAAAIRSPTGTIQLRSVQRSVSRRPETGALRICPVCKSFFHRPIPGPRGMSGDA